MLKQLDTLIGFAVVMSVVSMLIMVVTQAISSALALRGKNLVDALEALFLRYAPTLKENPKAAAEKQIDELNALFAGITTTLTNDEKVSFRGKLDSLAASFTNNTSFGKEEKDTANQKIAELKPLFADAKGAVTADEKTSAVAAVGELKKLVPKIASDNQARQLAEVILKKPALSDSMLPISGTAGIWRLIFWLKKWWEALKLASAIRPEECWEAIRRIAKSTEEEVKAFLSDYAKTSAPVAIAAAKTLQGTIQSADASQDKQALVDAMKSAIPGLDVTKLETHFNALIAKGAVTVQTGLEKWKADFQTVNDRAEQWFTMHTRRITVVLAFVAALVLQLDAFQLFTRLANDADLRNQLVNLAPGIQKRVDEALNVKFAGTVYYAALKELKTTNDDARKFEDPSETVIQTKSDAQEWLSEQAKSLDNNKKSALTTQYDQLVQSKSTERIKAAKDEVGEVAGLYDTSKLQLIPDPYPHPYFSKRCPFIHNVFEYLGLSGNEAGRHFFGMIAAAMLLALGAPFWFNLLKSLTNLRSSVAEQMDKEKEPASI